LAVLRIGPQVEGVRMELNAVKFVKVSWI
jgi:hypothetical protein